MIISLLIGFIFGIILINFSKRMKLQKSISLMKQPNRWNWVEIQNSISLMKQPNRWNWVEIQNRSF